MSFIDYLIGNKAEFLNAWSVWQRIFGVEPTVYDSYVFNHLGQIGELSVVLASTLALAVIVTLIIRLMVAK